MSGQLLISLLSPSLGILFCAAFFILWLKQPALNYSLTTAIGFFLTAGGFIIQDILPAWPYELQRIVSNLGFLGGLCAFMAAPLQRRQIVIPIAALATLLILTLLSLSWYLIVVPDLGARIAIASASLIIPVVMTIHKLLKVPNRRYSDRLLMAVLWFTLLLSLFRPAVAFIMPESFGSYTALEQSTYWGMVHFSYVMMAVSLAIAMFVAISLDLMDELHTEATTDSLSGLLNRRGFENTASTALAISTQRGRTSALMIADLDHFKAINDSHGHAVGDKVIQAIGQHILSVAGDAAICGRIGGEEFAILLPDHDEAEATKIAEAIRRDFNTLTTVSIGLVISNQPDTLSTLLGIADKALYAAKENGRNRVYILRQTDNDYRP